MRSGQIIWICGRCASDSVQSVHGAVAAAGAFAKNVSARQAGRRPTRSHRPRGDAAFARSVQNADSQNALCDAISKTLPHIHGRL